MKEDLDLRDGSGIQGGKSTVNINSKLFLKRLRFVAHSINRIK